jgi:hypothetical protein
VRCDPKRLLASPSEGQKAELEVPLNAWEQTTPILEVKKAYEGALIDQTSEEIASIVVRRYSSPHDTADPPSKGLQGQV